MPATIATQKIPSAGMSQIVYVTNSEKARCVVGSCIALVLHHRRNRTGALGHIVLPNSTKSKGPTGKFADTAVPHMVETLEKEGANRGGLVAKIFGGASMFASSGPMQIGCKNIEAVTELLRQLNIPISAEDVAGDKGRRVTFDCATGQVTVEIAGQPIQLFD